MNSRIGEPLTGAGTEFTSRTMNSGGWKVGKGGKVERKMRRFFPSFPTSSLLFPPFPTFSHFIFICVMSVKMRPTPCPLPLRWLAIAPGGGGSWQCYPGWRLRLHPLPGAILVLPLRGSSAPRFARPAGPSVAQKLWRAGRNYAGKVWLPKPATRWMPHWSCSLARNVVGLLRESSDCFTKVRESSRKFAQIRPVNPRCYALLRVGPILDANYTNER